MAQFIFGRELSAGVLPVIFSACVAVEGLPVCIFVDGMGMACVPGVLGVWRSICTSSAALIGIISMASSNNRPEMYVKQNQ